MTLRICHDWGEIEYIEAVCPYCHMTNTYYGGYYEDQIVRCSYPKCKKRFKLGEQE